MKLAKIEGKLVNLEHVVWFRRQPRFKHWELMLPSGQPLLVHSPVLAAAIEGLLLKQPVVDLDAVVAEAEKKVAS